MKILKILVQFIANTFYLVASFIPKKHGISSKKVENSEKRV